MNSPTKTIYRDFALLGGLVILVLFLLSIWVVYESYEEHSRRIQNKLENEAVRIDRTLIIEIENAAYLLESLGRQVSRVGNPKQGEIAQLLRAFYKEGYSKSNVFSWINSKQRLTVSSDRGVLAQPVDVSDRGYMKKAIITPWQPHIGRPIQGRISKRAIIPMSMGITNYNGDYLGALMIGIDLENLSRRLQRDIKDDDISFAVTNKSFTLLMESSREPHFFDTHFDVERLNRMNFTERPNGMYSRASLFGDDGIYSFFEVSLQYPFVIFMGHTNSEDVSAISRILLPRFLQLSVILGFVLIVLWMIRLRVTQPVTALSERAEAMLLGKFDVAKQPITGPSEIEALAEYLKRMGDYIRERQRIEEELLVKNHTLMKVREAAQLTNKVKAQFLEEITEELQRPTIAVLERAEAIKGQHFGPIANDKYLEHASRIHDHSGHILDLINEIRAISEAETGLLALDEKPIDLAFIVQKSVRIFHDTAAQRDIDVEVKLADHLPKLYADELRVKQIVLNMLHGAVTRIKPGDKMQFEVEEVRGELVMTLLFHPYKEEAGNGRKLKAFSAAINLHRQGQQRREEREAAQDRSMNHAGAASGLGFILTRLLVALHEGDLEIKQRPGRGTEMVVKFPEKRVISV